MTNSHYPIEAFLTISACHSASFSPSGLQLSYLSNVSGTDQIYITSTDGKRSKQLTQFENAISSASFSPVDENEITFTMDDGGNEKSQIYLLHVDSGAVEPLTNRPEFVFRRGGWSRDGKYIAYSSNERNGTDFDVYVMNMRTRATRCVFKPGGSCNNSGFSPTGEQLIANKSITNASNELFLIDLLGDSPPIPLTDREIPSRYTSLRWMPDATGCYLLSDEGSDLMTLRHLDLKNKQIRTLLAPKWEIEGISLTRDGQYMSVRTNEDGYSSVTVYATKSWEPVKNQDFPRGTMSGLTWSEDGRWLLFKLSSTDTNSDIWIWERTSNTVHQVTQTPMPLQKSLFVQPELVHYASFDALSIPAFIYMPKDSDLRDLPIIINIHGGPTAQFKPGFASLIQYFVHQGYAVVAPNVRGSSGYGKAYAELDDRERRLDSVRDLEYLHHYLVRERGADPQRIALMGASYGGYMVLAGLAFQPELWAAGVSTVGISNLESFLEGTASYRRKNRESEYGYLDHDRELLHTLSPIHKVDKIVAPLLIIHGANDPRVPLSEAQQIYSILSELGKPVELIVYPDEGHGLKKLANRLDVYPKVAEFLDNALQGIASQCHSEY